MSAVLLRRLSERDPIALHNFYQQHRDTLFDLARERLDLQGEFDAPAAQAAEFAAMQAVNEALWHAFNNAPSQQPSTVADVLRAVRSALDIAPISLRPPTAQSPVAATESPDTVPAAKAGRP